MNDSTAVLFDIYHGTTHDGPGMRTTFFFKGCPLNCLWCHNPEGIEFGQQIWWNHQKCIGCLLCMKSCANKAVTPDETGIHTDKEKCVLCGSCVNACPAEAMSFVARQWTLDELLNEALKDREFYKSFNGGVTASGGEPLVQHKFISKFFQELKQLGIHTALDTCGLAPEKAFEAVLPYTDCVLYDIKFVDSVLHQHYTGKQNTQIIKNFTNVINYKKEKNKELEIWIRTPLIPGSTATRENIGQISRYLAAGFKESIDRWELCTFNNLCVDKYKKLGRKWMYEGVPLMRENDANMLKDAAMQEGFPSEKLAVTGMILHE
ncbi:MAG TPA: glycyl-radical enzyme activating protein [Clostridia bacterium]